MEFASKLRWFLVITAAVLAFILIGWGLYSVASSIFKSGGGDRDIDSVAQVDSAVDEDIEFASHVRFEQDGPIIAKENQRSYTIDVSSNVVTMRIYAQYGQQVIKEQSYTNSDASYTAFINALKNLGVPDRFEGTTYEEDYEDSGTCPTGRRYIVEVGDDTRRWSTSCKGDGQGTAGFNMASVRQLFQKQVPDFSDLVSGVNNL